MMFVLKALISTAFMGVVAGLFIASLIGVFAIEFSLPTIAFLSVEGLGLILTLVLSALFFMRAYNYERYGDPHKPMIDQV